jgi:hypothetical protein
MGATSEVVSIFSFLTLVDGRHLTGGDPRAYKPNTFSHITSSTGMPFSRFS